MLIKDILTTIGLIILVIIFLISLGFILIIGHLLFYHIGNYFGYPIVFPFIYWTILIAAYIYDYKKK